MRTVLLLSCTLWKRGWMSASNGSTQCRWYCYVSASCSLPSSPSSESATIAPALWPRSRSSVSHPQSHGSCQNHLFYPHDTRIHIRLDPQRHCLDNPPVFPIAMSSLAALSLLYLSPSSRDPTVQNGDWPPSARMTQQIDRLSLTLY